MISFPFRDFHFHKLSQTTRLLACDNYPFPAPLLLFCMSPSTPHAHTHTFNLLTGKNVILINWNNITGKRWIINEIYSFYHLIKWTFQILVTDVTALDIYIHFMRSKREDKFSLPPVSKFGMKIIIIFLLRFIFCSSRDEYILW